MSEPLQFLIKSAFDATGITAATNSVKSIDAQINRVSRGFSQMMGLMGAGGIGAALFSFGKSSVMEFAKSEAGVAKLTKALQNLGTFTDADVKIQTDFARQLQLTTKYSDEDIMAIQAQLVTYGLYGDKLKQATQATLDLAVKTGSTETASKLMGKAFQGQTDTLARYGIKINEGTKGADKFEAVLKMVQQRMGGMANVEGSSLEGQLSRMTNRFDELKEKIGEQLMPVANAWLGWLGSATTASEKFFAGGNTEAKGIDLTIIGLKKKIEFETEYIRKALEMGEIDDEQTKQAIENLHKYMAALKRVEAQKLAQGLPVAGKPTLAGPNLDSAEDKKAQAEAIKNNKEYLKESEKAMSEESNILNFELTDRGQMYTRYFGKVEMDRRRDVALAGTSAKQLETNNKTMLVDLERDYEAASHSFSGGMKQSVDEMGVDLWNWKSNFNQVINSSVGPATQAFHNFFTKTSEGFMRLDSLAKDVFQGILRSFLSMLEQMAAKAVIYGIFSMFSGGSTLLGGSLSNFLSRSEGGPIPGREGSPVPILAHGGEFMLSANVVKAIKAGQPTSGINSVASLAAGGGGAVHVDMSGMTVNLNSSSNDAGSLFRQFTQKLSAEGADAIRFALTSQNVAARNAGRAV